MSIWEVSAVNNCISISCTGCRACEQICPQKCICMKEDNEGFLIPIIDYDACLNCGMCKIRCPQNALAKLNNRNSRVYAAKLNDKMTLSKSTSGGIFSAIALAAFAEDSYVFGAAYDDDLNVVHTCINSENELYILQGSKYVQSDVKYTYLEVKKLLEAEKKVIYSGTPCQIAGLKSYLNNSYENLLTVDLICHGVPSPLIFKKYIGWLSKKRKSIIKHYTFRSKAKQGWGVNHFYYCSDKRTWYGFARTDPYYKNFLLGNTYRESCYTCRYSNLNRVSDITLGDFWGIETCHPEFTDKNGVSVVLLNTEKAELFFNKLKNNISFTESNINEASEENDNLKNPTKRPEIRNTIYQEINEINDYNYIQNLMTVISFKDKLSSFMPVRVKISLKNLLYKKRGE